MGKNNKQIFSSFKRQSKSKKKQQEENIKYAQELGQKMLDSKKKVYGKWSKVKRFRV